MAVLRCPACDTLMRKSDESCQKCGNPSPVENEKGDNHHPKQGKIKQILAIGLMIIGGILVLLDIPVGALILVSGIILTLHGRYQHWWNQP